jgi:dTDP-4-dehydrorhamnose 3,5-epimerase
LVAYLSTETYAPAADAAVRWDDPTLAIDWPVASPSLSAKDAAAPLLSQIAPERLPRPA